MSNNFEITPENAARAVKKMSELMNCDYETAWKKYTHEIIFLMCIFTLLLFILTIKFPLFIRMHCITLRHNILCIFIIALSPFNSS